MPSASSQAVPIVLGLLLLVAALCIAICARSGGGRWGAEPYTEPGGSSLLVAAAEPHVDSVCTVPVRDGGAYRMEATGLLRSAGLPGTCYILPNRAISSCTLPEGGNDLLESAEIRSVDGQERCVVRFKKGLRAEEVQTVDRDVSNAFVQSSALYQAGVQQRAQEEARMADASDRRTAEALRVGRTADMKDEVASLFASTLNTAVEASTLLFQRDLELDILRREGQVVEQKHASAKALADAAAARLREREGQLSSAQSSFSQQEELIRQMRSKSTDAQGQLQSSNTLLTDKLSEAARMRVQRDSHMEQSMDAERNKSLSDIEAKVQSARMQGLQEQRALAQQEAEARRQEELERMKVHCRLGDWGEWASCSTTCGGGTRVRRRPVLVQPAHGGTPCGETAQVESCNTHACRTDCSYSTRSHSCLGTCGTGTMWQEYVIHAQPTNGGAACPSGGYWSSCWTGRECPPKGATFYTDCAYGGLSSTLGPGRYDIWNMGIPNDQLSSIRVNAGTTVTLYSDANYSGYNLTLGSDIRCLWDFPGWNDVVSSIVIS